MITFYTKNIDKTAYKKIVRNMVMFNADDGTPMSGYKAWRKFEEEWELNIFPVAEADTTFKSYWESLNVETNDAMAWGVTGKKFINMFVIDSHNPFTVRSNSMPLGHEVLHAVYQEGVGTFHITRKHDAPEGKAGTRGAAQTVIVHDNWYGTKETTKFWIRYGMIWLPITIPYYPIKQAKKDYAI